MHPENQARALRRVIGIEAELADFFRSLEHRLEDERKRKPTGRVQRLNNLPGVLRNLLQ